MRRLVPILLAVATGLVSPGMAEQRPGERVYHAARPGAVAEARQRLASGDARLRDALDTLAAEADDARFTDRDRAGLLGSAAQTLGLAWRFTGHRRYAEQATRFVRAWFVDEATRMMPYATVPERWPHEQISRVDQADLATILWRAGIVYREPAYTALVDGFASDRDGWVRLTFVDE